MAAVVRMVSNADAEHSPVIREMLNYFLSPSGMVRTHKFSEGDIQRIAELLSHSTSEWESSWSSAPRVYCVLRLIGLESAMSELMKEGITTDVWFPFNNKSLTSVLSPGDKDRFLAKQSMVETEAFYLEKDLKKGRKCRHVSFHHDDDVPLERTCFLGQGSFGVVHQVRSKLSHKVYARKQTPRAKAFLKTQKQFEAFEREREVMMKINHHHCIEFVRGPSRVNRLKAYGIGNVDWKLYHPQISRSSHFASCGDQLGSISLRSSSLISTKERTAAYVFWLPVKSLSVPT